MCKLVTCSLLSKVHDQHVGEIDSKLPKKKQQKWVQTLDYHANSEVVGLPKEYTIKILTNQMYMHTHTHSLMGGDCCYS